MRSPPSASPPPTYPRAYQNAGGHEPAWMREEAAQLQPAPVGVAAYPPTAGSVHGETTPLRGSAPSTAPSSVGRPGRGYQGMAPPVDIRAAGVYRPYAHPKQIRRGCCLSIFLGINALTVLSALSVAVAEILSVIYHRLSPQGIAIRVYGVILAFLIVFNELSLTRFVRETPLLQNWVSRGSIYAFVGLLALEQYAEKTASAGAVNLYIFCAGMGLVALGVLYFCMGVLCLKRIHDRKNADFTILRSQAELEEALRQQVESSMGKAAYDAQGGSVVI